MGTYRWGYKSPNMGYKYCYPTYNPGYKLAMNLQVPTQATPSDLFFRA